MIAYNLIKKITSIRERQFEGETEAKKIILGFLKENKIDFKNQDFEVFVPEFEKCELKIDDKKIDCLPASFKSGKINSKGTILSNTWFDVPENVSGIFFNPYSKKISRSIHFFEPAISVNKKDILKITNAKKIDGEIIVNKKKHNSTNILVGNLKNPKNIIFSHYDSIETGAIDNASGTAVMLEIILDKKKLTDNLFVFAGAEELSYDEDFYWGFGYRIFEEKYLKILDEVKKIIVVDCVGQTKTQLLENNDLITQAFPIKNKEKFKNKTILVAGDFEKLMEVYHSKSDTIKEIKKYFLKESIKIILNLLK